MCSRAMLILRRMLTAMGGLSTIMGRGKNTTTTSRATLQVLQEIVDGHPLLFRSRSVKTLVIASYK